MLRPKKKITKRELKEDALVTTYMKATNFFYEKKKLLSSVATGVGVVIVISIIYLNNRAADAEKAATELGKIYKFCDSGQYQLAINGIPEKNIMGLKAIVENYGSSHPGETAKFYLANSYFSLGNYDEALRYFKDYGGGDVLLKVSALSGIAACYEAREDYKEAAKYFEKAAYKNNQDLNVAENLYNAARDYTKAGEKEKAIELLKKLKKNYPASTHARDVEKLLAAWSV